MGEGWRWDVTGDLIVTMTCGHEATVEPDPMFPSDPVGPTLRQYGFHCLECNLSVGVCA